MKVTIIGTPNTEKAINYIADKIKSEMKEVKHAG
jgi:hypothetical protein